jgi:hypothetical protein
MLDWLFRLIGKVADKPKQSSFLEDDIDPTKLWRNYKDEDAEWEHLLNIIGEEADKEATPIPVTNRDRLKKVFVHLGLPRTKQGAISRQKHLGWHVRKLNLNMEKRPLGTYPGS